jgi:hypothetical protein
MTPTSIRVSMNWRSVGRATGAVKALGDAAIEDDTDAVVVRRVWLDGRVGTDSSTGATHDAVVKETMDPYPVPVVFVAYARK